MWDALACDDWIWQEPPASPPYAAMAPAAREADSEWYNAVKDLASGTFGGIAQVVTGHPLGGCFSVVDEQQCPSLIGDESLTKAGGALSRYHKSALADATARSANGQVAVFGNDGLCQKNFCWRRLRGFVQGSGLAASGCGTYYQKALQ